MNARPTRVPTALAALALGVPEGTIRQWANRKKITRYGTRRQALYDLDELARLATRSKAPGTLPPATPPSSDPPPSP